MSSSLITSIKYNPIFVASKAIGMFPFSIVNGTLVVDWLLVCYSVVVTTIVSLLGYISFVQVVTKPDPTISVSKLMIETIMLVHILQPPMFLGIILRHRNILYQTVSCLQRLKTIFYKMEFKKIDNKTTKCFGLLDVFHPLIAIVIFHLLGNFPPGLLKLFVYLTIVLFGAYLCLSQFCLLLNIACDFLEAEIDVLREVKRTFFRNLNTKKMIEQLIEINNQISLAAENITSMYSYQLFYVMSSKYVWTILHMFFIVHNVTKNLSPMRYRLILGDFIMLSLSFGHSWKISYTSERAIKKSKEFNTLLYQLMIDDTTNEILQNDKLRLHISMKREVRFSACGFFSLDYSLLHSMIASATTYLVILIQFGQDTSGQKSAVTMTNLTSTPLPMTTFLWNG